MSFSLSWVAVKDVSYEAALARLALNRSGEMVSYAESPVSACQLPGGWILVVARGCDHPIIRSDALANLSIGGEAVACSIEEHVMFSSSELWSNGVSRWRVEHDAQKSIDDLSSSGDLPHDFASMRSTCTEQQIAEGGADADVDLYFEIPLALAKSRVGFKHDEANLATESAFELLLVSDHSRPSASKQRWWQFRR